MPTSTRCRALVAGFGRPGMRDLDFGRQLVRYLEGIGWPEGVVVEDLSYAAPLVLDRLRELEPAKVVLVGAAARGFDPPGALRRYRLRNQHLPRTCNGASKSPCRAWWTSTTPWP
jgi:Ni,Fe-hydrogenase maturation factor